MPSLYTGLLSILVLRPNNQPFENVRIRVFDNANVDKTQALLGNAEMFTDAFGRIQRLVSATTVPAGIYKFQTIIPGYQPETVESLPGFTGQGIFVLRPQPITELTGYSFQSIPTYLSPMAPVRLVITAPASDEWQLIETTVTQGANVSKAESPVDPVTGEALIPVRSWVHLMPRPNLVPDGETFRVDPDFSEKVVLTFSSITDAGTYETDLNPINLMFANIFPNAEYNDLVLYTNGMFHLAKWITPFRELTVNRGYYSDVMIWLINIQPGDTVTLWHANYDRAGNNVGNVPITAPGGFFHSAGNRVVRVRLRYPDNPAIVRALLHFKVNNVTVSESLTVHYK